jgi:hypothetical protein
MRILARHYWVGKDHREHFRRWQVRRFTATIRVFQNWRIYEGPDPKVPRIIEKIREILDRIDRGDGSVFQRGGYEPSIGINHRKLLLHVSRRELKNWVRMLCQREHRPEDRAGHLSLNWGMGLLN